MCERKDAREAQNAAADMLAAACLHYCPDEVGMALKSVYDSTLFEGIPDSFKELLAKLK